MMSDLYQLASLLFLLVFIMLMLGNIAMTIADFNCPGYKDRILPTITETELPNMEEMGIISGNIETGNVTNPTEEKCDIGCGGSWFKNSFLSPIYKTCYDACIKAQQNIVKVTTTISILGNGIKTTMGYLYAILSAITSPCANMGIISALIVTPIVITLLVFILRIIRGA